MTIGKDVTLVSIIQQIPGSSCDDVDITFRTVVGLRPFVMK